MLNREEKNKLKIIESTIGKKLERFSIKQKQLYKECYYVEEKQFIIDLQIESIQINKFPESITDLLHLKRLSMIDNKISKIPHSIAKLKYLEILRLQRNRIKKIPKCIGALENLKHLNLERNKLKHLPKQIGNLNSLKGLVF
ncbi:MAG: hypothetical protein GF317_03630, partial [Candidatus Lokiarchaeota archaeon]|nr:hypothetical protein [Candidatus Lokiarchaeota archaeon]MBD3198978.1 hypothetical protein [Candidatus Lokiarchaeota archaeon]